MKLHHVGVACADINEEIANIHRLHKVIDQTPVVFDEQQNAELVMLTLEDGTNIELISGKQVENLVKKRISYYHLCFEVDDINAEIERLTGEGAMLVSPPKPAILFNNREVAFLYLSYGLIELVSSH
ncbi:methylmalonyl-CoA epimerase [Mucilaginibacter yixingensis]|uniref:Methylmalonyl-CoA epimerase n=2 Tax=Mucilaginibacter yixingensis TaxID=1295612 RepID=A0A2T5J8J4_9SPHI|nr:methylmalonyl-CoA epimerase [Mucilaginibacter yixingensis]